MAQAPARAGRLVSHRRSPRPTAYFKGRLNLRCISAAARSKVTDVPSLNLLLGSRQAARRTPRHLPTLWLSKNPAGRAHRAAKCAPKAQIKALHHHEQMHRNRSDAVCGGVRPGCALYSTARGTAEVLGRYRSLGGGQEKVVYNMHMPHRLASFSIPQSHISCSHTARSGRP